MFTDNSITDIWCFNLKLKQFKIHFLILFHDICVTLLGPELVFLHYRGKHLDAVNQIAHLLYIILGVTVVTWW